MLVGEKYQDNQLQFPIGSKYIQGPVQQTPAINHTLQCACLHSEA